MADKLQVGSSGKLKVKSNGKLQLGGTSCCCGGGGGGTRTDTTLVGCQFQSFCDANCGYTYTRLDTSGGFPPTFTAVTLNLSFDITVGVAKGGGFFGVTSVAGHFSGSAIKGLEFGPSTCVWSQPVLNPADIAVFYTGGTVNWSDGSADDAKQVMTAIHIGCSDSSFFVTGGEGGFYASGPSTHCPEAATYTEIVGGPASFITPGSVVVSVDDTPP